jgi:hypothetical protein
MPVGEGKPVRKTITNKQTYLKSTVLASTIPPLFRGLKPGLKPDQRMPFAPERPPDEGAQAEPP